MRLVSRDRSAFGSAAFHNREPSAHAEMKEVLGATVQRLDDGVAEEVLRTRRTVFLPEVEPEGLARSFVEPRHSGLILRHRTRSVIAAPLFVGSEVAGVLTLVRFGQAAPYTEHDRMLVDDVADRASLALRTTSVLAELTLSERRSRFLAEAGAVLGSSLEHEEILERITALLVQQYVM